MCETQAIAPCSASLRTCYTLYVKGQNLWQMLHGTVSVTSVVSIIGESIFFNSQIIPLTLNVSTIWLVGCWLMLATQRWNRNWVYSRITLALVTLRWCQCHVVNQTLYMHIAQVRTAITTINVLSGRLTKWHIHMELNLSFILQWPGHAHPCCSGLVEIRVGIQ